MLIKNNFILDYSDYSIFKTQYGLNSPKSITEYFHGKIGWCPFCLKNTVKIYNQSDSFIYSFGPWREMYETVWQCDCGWWQIEFYSYIEEENIYKDWYKTVHSAQKYCRLI